MVSEQNNWYRVNFSSGIITDEIQGCLVLCEGSSLAGEAGLFEMSYEIEFAHPQSPSITATNSILGAGGFTIPFSSMSPSTSYAVDGVTTDTGTYNFWNLIQGIYVVTNGQNNYTPNTLNWSYPCFLGQTYIVRIRCYVTSLSSSNTGFTFYQSFGALLTNDPISLTSGNFPSTDLTGLQAYQIGSADSVYTNTSYQLRSDKGRVETNDQNDRSVITSPFSSLSTASNYGSDRYSEQKSTGAFRHQ
jgi:hypothetical protein